MIPFLWTLCPSIFQPQEASYAKELESRAMRPGGKGKREVKNVGDPNMPKKYRSEL